MNHSIQELKLCYTSLNFNEKSQLRSLKINSQEEKGYNN